MTELKSYENISNFKIHFKTFFDRVDSEFINLRVTLSEDLVNLVKSAIINEETDYDFYNGTENDQRKRYKVKKWIYNSLTHHVLFDKELIENKISQFSFTKVSYLGVC